jgi:Tol biopolymer transport system component
MKKLVLIFMAASMMGSITALAQPKAGGKPIPITSSYNQRFMNPVWSPDGKKIAITGDNFNGIWVMDANGRNLKAVTHDTGAGFGMTWSFDNHSILARTTVQEKVSRYNEIKLYNLQNGQETVLVGKSRDIQGVPVWSEQETRVAVKMGSRTEEVPTGKTALKAAPIAPKAAAGSVARTILTNPALASKEIKGFEQFEGRTQFNAAISPLGDKIIFQVGGKGLYLCNADGSGLKFLGKGERASWMPDGKHVIVTIVTDDGHVITAADLFAVNIETAQYELLTGNTDLKAVKPCVSPNGKKVAFNDAETGVVYVMDLQ